MDRPIWLGRIRARARRLYVPLAPDDRAGFDTELDRSIGELLPILGPALGLLVILFTAWDAWIDAAHVAWTLRIRIGMVALGAFGYARWRAGLPPRRRLALVYVTHVGAMTVSAAMLDGGLVLALPGLTGVLFLLALLEPRVRRWLAVASVPAVLFVLFAALRLPRTLFVNSVLLYAATALLACCVAFVTNGLRRRAFLAEKALLHASRYDSLSGALARGYVSELARHDVAVARRHNHPLAAAMLDIDHFKRVNDSHGHPVGDQVLAAFAAVCRGAMRMSDYLGRIGGEEFVCVMPETDLGDAVACAERIRVAVAAMTVPTAAGPLHITVSIGVAALDRRQGDWPSLLSAADAALYRAKASGRDRTVAASSSS